MSSTARLFLVVCFIALATPNRESLSGTAVKILKIAWLYIVTGTRG